MQISSNILYNNYDIEKFIYQAPANKLLNIVKELEKKPPNEEIVKKMINKIDIYA